MREYVQGISLKIEQNKGETRKHQTTSKKQPLLK